MVHISASQLSIMSAMSCGGAGRGAATGQEGPQQQAELITAAMQARVLVSEPLAMALGVQ